MSLKRNNKCGGRSATGNAKHMDTIKAIMPIFDSIADNFEILVVLELFFVLENREDEGRETPLTAEMSISAPFVDVRTTNEFVVRGDDDNCCLCCRIEAGDST